MGARLLLITIISIITTYSCNTYSNNDKQDFVVHKDLSQIRERGKLVAITDYNSTSYFIYKGEPMGFQYELLQEFADYLDLELEILTENDLHVSFDMINKGDADLMALNLSINNQRKEMIRFSAPIGQTRQVLVQRRPDDWLQMTMDDLDSELVRNQLDLAGKTVYVQSGSSYAQRLKNLQDEIGDSINIVEVPMEVEELITLVANKEIDYTVCDENVGKVNRTYYTNLDVNTPVSFPQNYAWAVRKSGSDELVTSLNLWINTYKKSHNYALLYSKYFKNSRSKRIVQSDSYTLLTGQISDYDNYFMQYSDSIGWDWRLLASLVAQESRFDPVVTSWAGAYGLMQIMPATGEHYGIDVRSSPENNIIAGIKYITWLQELFEDKVVDEEERLKFILASYNVGPGHVLDARRLARKNGKDPEIWDDNVAYFLLRKSEPEFYHDPVVEHGFCRGEEPFNYVTQIIERYDHYLNIVPEASLASVK
ncbi:MAG: transporter substrate-binding domain-containing protein [Bacteroidales bacterium]|nr:transporter substrate-binding domain-containing protein [Bacteroidales bacterium]